MIVALRVRGPVVAWHARLVAALAADGHEAGIAIEPGAAAPPPGMRLVLALEQRIYGKRPRLLDVVPASEVRSATADPDVTISLEGPRPGPGVRLQPLFDGTPGEAALVARLLEGAAPEITIEVWGPTARTLVRGLPAIERPDLLSQSLEHVYSRLVTLLVQGVRNLHEPQAAPTNETLATRPASAPRPLRFVAAGLRQRLLNRVQPSRRRHGDWSIAYRFRAGSESDTDWDGPPFRHLPDGGDRFLADPFPLELEGKLHLFFEDFPRATRKGVISAVTIVPDGVASDRRVVLEQPVHLSYPFVFRHGGEIYMMPEMSAARRIQLFRADPFPDRWVPDRVLIDGISASDATLVEHAGRFWIFATINEPGQSTWDQLGLFEAPTPFGPWVPHPGNPVLIDAGQARPAGAMWHEGETLMRIVQDCRAGYGAGMAICRVDRLDSGGYAQSVVRRLQPPDGLGAEGVHTLNRAGDFETIDLRPPYIARPFSRKREKGPREARSDEGAGR